MFENPLMLAGLGGAAVPLALHLLSRAQYRRVDWGAMMFLAEEQFNELRSARVKRWTLLGLRMGVVALLAVALAQPVVQRNGSAPAGKTLAAIVVDCSGSMTYDEGGRTRMDLARGAVLQILSRLQRGDQATIVVAGGTQQVIRPTGDLESLAARVADLDAGRGVANLSEALTTALNVLDRESAALGAQRREIYVVCDWQAGSWSGVSESFISAWKDRIAKSARLERFVVTPVGGEGSANVAVESVAAAGLPVIRGIPNRLEVTLRNFGAQPRAGVGVKLAMGSAGAVKELAQASVNLPERAAATVGADLTFTSAGPQVVSATVKSRGLAGDDRLDAVVDVREATRVGVVGGAGAAPGSGDASRFVAAALAPYQSARRRGIDPATVETLSAASLVTANLADYEVVVLADVASLDAQTAQKLERFVSGGGGLLISVGERTQWRDLNATMYRNGAGLLPAELGEAAEEAL